MNIKNHAYWEEKETILEKYTTDITLPFAEEKTQTVNKHVKRWLDSLMIREM